MSLKEALLDLLFPPRCPICGRSSDEEKDAPCPPCRQADFWISGPQAVVPGAPLSGASAPGGIVGR